MNERDKLIEQLIQEKGGTKEQYLSLLNKIAYHESAGTMDPKLKQFGGGPGRGKYQFEVGKNEGAITAAKRTKQYMESKGQKVPKWLQEATKGNDLDVSNLTEQQQDVLFLGNMRMHPKADFAKVWKGEESIADFWANHHWAGSEEDRKARIDSFNHSMQRFQKPSGQEEALVNQQQPQRRNFRVETPVAQTTVDNIPQVQEQRGQLKQQPEAIAQAQQILDTSKYKDLYSYLQQAPKNHGELNSFNAGGRHEQNPHGGIPMGIGANGRLNTVEEGETSYNFGDETFVFSDRITANDKANGVAFEGPIIDNAFAYGGNTNNCGGPGQPPCPPIDKKFEILNEVILNHKKPHPSIVSDKNNPRYQAYQDSLGLYNKGIKDLRSGKGYESLTYFEDKPRNEYPFALDSDKNNNNRERILSKKELAKEIAKYGQRDYEYTMSGKAKARYEASKNGGMYDDGEHLHKYQFPYSEIDQLRNHYNEMPKLFPEGQKIKPTSVVFGPESDPVALYDKPRQPIYTEDSPQADIIRKQMLLKQRGTYDGPIDGIWGKESEKALAKTDFKSKEGRPIYQDMQFGKYKDYFEVQGMHDTDPETTVIRMTDKNPHNLHTVKQLEGYLRQQNPNKKFKITGKGLSKNNNKQTK